jgi:GNAT superfamily N-acetyltransferase
MTEPAESDAVLEPPRRLRADDDVNSFASGATELDTWLRRFGWENQRAGNAVTYVACRGGVVLGYYALATAAYARDIAPGRLRTGRPSEGPCLLLARLAVDATAQGQGVGSALLRDAITRTLAVSEQAGVAALLVHCRDDDARKFYLHSADFLASPVEPMHLFLPLKAIRRLIAGE